MTFRPQTAGAILALLLPLLILLTGGATARAEERLNRSGYLRVTIDPDLYESNLWQTNYRSSLKDLFDREAHEFSERLAEGLERTAFRGRLRVLEEVRGDAANLAERLERDTFLITVDIRSRYGLAGSGSLMACLSAASCFLLAPFDLFSYEAESQAQVDGFYIDPGGRKLRLVQSSYRSRKTVSGSFFEVNNLKQEMQWIDELTGETLGDLRGEILADFPPKLVRRAWRKAAGALDQPPAGGIGVPGLPSAPRPGAEPPSSLPQDTPPPREDGPEGEALDLQALVRLVSPSVFKVRVDDRVASGFVISERGYGVTSLSHVHQAENIRIRFHNGRELKAREILAEPALDLAVISFLPGEATPLSLGDSDRLQGIDPLYAIGYPLEHGLSVHPVPAVELDLHRQPPLLELGTELVPGNAGGPLLNDRGEVVGVLRLPPGESKTGVSSATPITEARRTFFHLLD